MLLLAFKKPPSMLEGLLSNCNSPNSESESSLFGQPSITANVQTVCHKQCLYQQMFHYKLQIFVMQESVQERKKYCAVLQIVIQE